MKTVHEYLKGDHVCGHENGSTDFFVSVSNIMASVQVLLLSNYYEYSPMNHHNQ